MQLVLSPDCTSRGNIWNETNTDAVQTAVPYFKQPTVLVSHQSASILHELLLHQQLVKLTVGNTSGSYTVAWGDGLLREENATEHSYSIPGIFSIQGELFHCYMLHVYAAGVCCTCMLHVYATILIYGALIRATV